MRSISATEARKNFFRLLDTAVKGEPVVITRHGVALELVRSLPKKKGSRKSASLNYKQAIIGPLASADKWGWEWSSEQELNFKGTDRR